MSRIGCVLTLVACTGATVDTADDLEPGCISLDADRLEFGDLRVRTTATRRVRTTNACEGVLDLESITFEGAGQPFRLSAPAKTRLFQDATEQLTVSFDPVVFGTYTDAIHIGSNDPDTPLAVVAVSGRGVGQQLELSADALDFPDTPVGCTQTRALALRNTGEWDLTISQVELINTNGPFALDLHPDVNGALPFVVPGTRDGEPNAAIVDIAYTPDIYDREDGEALRIKTDSLFERDRLLELVGSSPEPIWHTDTHVIDFAIETDVVFTLLRDNTSMVDNYGDVFDNLDEYASRLAAVIASPRVALITMDDGCALGPDPWIDERYSASDASAAFETMADLSFTLGGYGVRFRQGSELAKRALSAENVGPGGCNEGLLREHARLMVVHISDYEDQSPDPWPTYLASLRSLKTDPDHVTVHAVAGDIPDGCDTALPGTGFHEQTVATGGDFFSVCGAPWGDKLDLPTREWRSSVTLPLSRQAVPETIRAELDRQGAPHTYDADENSITIDRARAPAQSGTLEIRYVPKQDCPE